MLSLLLSLVDDRLLDDWLLLLLELLGDDELVDKLDSDDSDDELELTDVSLLLSLDSDVELLLGLDDDEVESVESDEEDEVGLLLLLPLVDVLESDELLLRNCDVLLLLVDGLESLDALDVLVELSELDTDDSDDDENDELDALEYDESEDDDDEANAVLWLLVEELD